MLFQSSSNSFTTSGRKYLTSVAYGTWSTMFAVPAMNVPAFAAAVQCLGKIGKELYFEMNPESVSGDLRTKCRPCLDRVFSQVVLRTLNDAKSAFAAFHFESGVAIYFRLGVL